ncbi:MAG: hypothetical protein WBG58_19530 [Ignavibacteriaceae bacterium]
MRNKLFVLITGIAAITFFFGFLLAPASPGSTVYELKVIKVEGVWRVVDASDYSKRKVKVKKKDTIVWTIEGTNAYFQFSNSVFDAAGVSDSLKNGSTKFVADGKKLKLKVRDDAPLGPQVYAVFCSADGVFAQGESPPKIVIE